MLRLQNVVWMISAVTTLVETKHSKLGKNIWDEDISFCKAAEPMMFLELRCTELCNPALAILHGMARLLATGRGIEWLQVEGFKWQAGTVDDYEDIKFIELNNFLLSNFPGEKKLKDDGSSK